MTFTPSGVFPTRCALPFVVRVSLNQVRRRYAKPVSPLRHLGQLRTHTWHARTEHPARVKDTRTPNRARPAALAVMASREATQARLSMPKRKRMATDRQVPRAQADPARRGARVVDMAVHTGSCTTLDTETVATVRYATPASAPDQSHSRTPAFPSARTQRARQCRRHPFAVRP